MKVHFIGIGGIGLSGLARFLKYNGHMVKGSDISETPLTKKLQNEGIEVLIPQRSSNIGGDEDMVIYSAAIKSDNDELIEAKKRGIKTLSRSQALPFILKEHKVYSVAGAHGKSTTTAILASILKEANAIIGAESKEFGSNVRFRDSSTLVFEADESDGSFLNSNPYCAIVTNAEPEHMDYYDYDLKRFYQTYQDFLMRARVRVINCEDPFLNGLDMEAVRLYPQKDIRIKRYFLKDDEPYIAFELKDLGEFEVWGFGEHIALDASLAILAAMQEMDVEEIRENIKNYRGIKKRFDIVQKGEEFIVIDDYAHHPTEIEATLSSLAHFANLKGLKEITIIWQPHKYSRVIDNIESFKRCFKGTTRLIILPVWAAGEEPRKIDFKREFAGYNPLFADRVKKERDRYLLMKNQQVVEELKSGVIIGFGAGDITYQLRGLK